MKHYWHWAIILGTVLHLFGFGQDFNSLIGGFLAIVLIIAGMDMMLNKKTLGQAAGPAIAGAFALSFIPPFIVGIIHGLWASHPVLLIMVAVVALVAGTNLFRWFRPRSLAGQGVRSGGGRAVPVPRRWRQ